MTAASEMKTKMNEAGFDDIQKQKYINKKQAKPDKEPAWWINGAFVIVVHIITAMSLLLYSPSFNTGVMTFFICQLAMFGITVGYHRLWSHRAYEAKTPLRVVLAFLGTLGFQGSIKWWVLRHRIHHRWTDTKDDPYSAAEGFWFSHMGWIFKKPHYPKMKLIDASDLNADPVVRFQHKHYVPLALVSGFALPTLIGALWGDALGGFLYGGILSRVVIWHSTFCINSFAHWAGDQIYSTEISARGNLLLAIMTNGEGYHNFHHEFPKDFRNGYRLFDWDPSKWIIFLLHTFTNQVPSVTRVPDNEVQKAIANMELYRAQEKRQKCDWGVDSSLLPVITYEEYKQRQESEGKEWLLVDEFVLDVSSFKEAHPGGAKVLKNYYGKDSTKAFYGGLNMHTKAARTMTAMLRVAKIEKPERTISCISSPDSK
ncbi:6124_t:CDS:2 [Funneliformis mosseae]|uniref:Acyl-CoA desaturase n=1 Tax=Funneliformis mosseae TaxID=27381 RepID=A0A9N8WK82_FUNMO|nr:6124_t:CDS:2 [Funneliformis mosseae]